MKNNLSKMNRAVPQFAKDDGKGLIDNIVVSVSDFETKDESKVVRADLEGLLSLLE